MIYAGRYNSESGPRVVAAKQNGSVWIHKEASDLLTFTDGFDFTDDTWHLMENPEYERMLSPIEHPGKIVCVGLNYKDHAKEMSAELPVEPLLFMKSPHSISGPFDPILRPPKSDTLDYEIELALLIQKKLSYSSETESAAGIMGLTIMIDVSERTMQKHRGGQWTKGKSADSFAPLGPFVLITSNAEELNAARNMELRVNNSTMQQSTTAEMIFSPVSLVSHISHFMSLYPGDVISTGTPAGVGMGKNPPVYLQPGDQVTCTIEGIPGEQRHTIQQV